MRIKEEQICAVIRLGRCWLATDGDTPQVLNILTVMQWKREKSLKHFAAFRWEMDRVK